MMVLKDIANLRVLRIKELRAELQRRGLNKDGVKETLVKRLQKEIEKENKNLIIIFHKN